MDWHLQTTAINIGLTHGVIAQLGERVVRNDEVRSSILLGSTIQRKTRHWCGFFMSACLPISWTKCWEPSIKFHQPRKPNVGDEKLPMPGKMVDRSLVSTPIHFANVAPI